MKQTIISLVGVCGQLRYAITVQRSNQNTCTSQAKIVGIYLFYTMYDFIRTSVIKLWESLLTQKITLFCVMRNWHRDIYSLNFL